MTELPNIKIKGKFSLREPEVQAGDIFRILPFKRSILVSAVTGGFFIAFSVPLVTVSEFAGVSPDGSLFTLVSTLFTLFWMLGWSVGVCLLGCIFVVTLFGRESIHAAPGRFTVRVGLFGAGIGAIYRTDEIEKLRWVVPAAKSPVSWRGPHVAFDYRDNVIHFGSDISHEQAQALIGELGEAFSRPGPTHEADVSDTVAVTREVDAARGRGHQEPVTLQSPSAMALLVANAIPILGVLFAGWQVGEVMLLFWAESAVVGFYNLCKMWVVGRWAVLLSGPFFAGHYGGFMAMHLLFIYGFFLGGMEGDSDTQLTSVFADFVALAPALLALLVSHGISFRSNFIGRREYEGRTIAQQMGEPYKRIVIMHVTIIVGGFLTMALTNALPALLLMIALKVCVDLLSHIKERE